MTSDQKPLVIFHSPCRDGFTAAWIAAKHFHGYRSVDFLGAAYGDAPPDSRLVEGRQVFILDFSYSREEIEAIADEAESVVVLDHHETAERALSGSWGSNVEVVFDMERSGARLAWDHWFGGDPPEIVRYIEDRDLWRWELPDSREISAYIGTLPYSLSAWDQLETDLSTETGRIEVAGIGAAVLRRDRQHVERAAEGAEILCGIPFVNSCVLQSDIGDWLKEGVPFVVIWWVENGVYRYSLRSGPDGANVAEIAESFPGGGGHKHAAGFRAGSPALVIHNLVQNGFVPR